jgi:hypothetical protein
LRTATVDETSRILLIPQIVFHVLDIGRQGEIIVDNNPVGFGDP